MPSTPKRSCQLVSLMVVLGSAIAVLTAVATTNLSGCSAHFEQRNMPAALRRGYNTAFFDRHARPYRAQASIHIAHAVQHDYLLLTPLADHARVDAESDARYLSDFENPPRIGPEMMTFGPHTGQAAWRVYQAIDWTHEHHDQTYDILADAGIPWPEKARATRDSVEWYLERLRGTARSPAPLDVTMRRAGTMMKPYFTLFRNQYPRSSTFFFFAHWWHPVIYEAMMIAGNDLEQDEAVAVTHATSNQVLRDRPQRMLLSRELMPRYARMSPESANIFDNLHMLHGIVYDILAYEGWSIDDKRAELYRVVDAMSEKPGDRELVRRFPEPFPTMDPRCYEPWMRGMDGEMSRIMREMLEEMWPMMSPDGSREVPAAVAEQARLKLTPGQQPGEHPGSFHDALMRIVPNMKMAPESMRPGAGDAHMTKMMLEGWRSRTANMPSVPGISMAEDPKLAGPACGGSASIDGTSGDVAKGETR